MGEWWHDLWNDPVNKNPWAIPALVLIILGMFVAFEVIDRIQRRNRRRKQETSMNDAADPQPIGGRWVESADDRQERERQRVEAGRVIAAARAAALPKEPAENAVFDDEETGRRYVFGQGEWHEIPKPDGADELNTVEQSYGDGETLTVETRATIDDGSPAREMGEESRRLDTLMHTDPRLIADPLGAAWPVKQPSFYTQGEGHGTGEAGREVADWWRGQNPQGPQPARNILAGKPVMAAAPVPTPLVRPARETCPHCEGTGYMPSISDHLRDSIALLGDPGDEIVRAFYAELLSVAPDLASLFPHDLLDPASPPSTEPVPPAQEWRNWPDDVKRAMLLRAGMIGEHDPLPEDPPKQLVTGRQQRDKLLKALVALSDLYDPADAEKMDKLDTALKAFGRSHAAFARPDGTIKGATWEEYAAVKEVLFRTLVAAAGAAWRPELTAAWSQAYDYAAAVMVAEQYRSGFSAPRFPRA